MTDIYRQEGRGKQQYWGGGGGGGDQQHDQQLWGGSYYGQQHQQQSWAYQAAKVITAATAGGSLLILSGLTLAGTVIALTVATPLLVIFSPVLVPALITVFTLATGMFASGGFSVAAVTVLTWMYRYMTGDRPAGANSLDQATHKLGSKAREFKDRSEHAMGMGGGGHYGTGGGLHTGGAGVGIHAGGGGGTYSS